MTTSHLALLAAFAFILGCSSSDKTTTTADTGSDMDGMDLDADQDAPANADTMPGETGSTTLAAPVLTDVMKMAGALHVTWKNVQTDCDSVDVERKTDTGDYKVAYTVPGTVNNKMDTAATMNMTYTYRVRCKKGAEYSPYSNEMSKNPVL